MLFVVVVVVVNNSKSNDDKGKYFLQKKKKSTMTTFASRVAIVSRLPASKFYAYSNKIHINLNLIDQTKALLYHSSVRYICMGISSKKH